MYIPVKRTRGTKVIPLIRLLESLVENTSEYIDEMYSKDDLEFCNFLKWDIAFGCETGNMLLNYISADYPLINDYFIKKKNIISKYKKHQLKIKTDKHLLMYYVERALKDNEQPRKKIDPSSVWTELIAEIEIAFERSEALDKLLEDSNRELKNAYFQTTVFNNILVLIVSSLNAIQTNLDAYKDEKFMRKVNNSRKLKLLIILKMISNQFDIPLETFTSNGLSIPIQELEIVMDEGLYPSVSTTIKTIEQRRRQKEKQSPPSSLGEFYIAKPVDVDDLRVEAIKQALPKDINLNTIDEPDDLDNLEGIEDSEILHLLKEQARKYYESM